LFRLVALTPRPDLADLATEAGFADQAHMSREVRRLCSATPTELVAQLSV
jgi:AraC-like DNA-binding protein